MEIYQDRPTTQSVWSPAPIGDGVSPEEALAELNRILQSDDFPATLRNRRFLSFIVDMALDANGSGRRVTAHDVATRVFGRPESFNTMTDPIVRIEAGKLRRDLETYYLKSGRRSSLRIHVPRGGYDPVFTRHDPAPAAAADPALCATGDLAADARAELGRVLASADFPASERNRRFLAYVVEMELEGRIEEINAKSVATLVFGRRASFDPNKDPIVRIEAGKLRRDLETYYLKSGRHNPLRLSIPRGGYRPHFAYPAA
jgi:hypothetical protein